MVNPNDVVNKILGEQTAVYYKEGKKGVCEHCGQYTIVYGQGFHGGVSLCKKCSLKTPLV